MTITDNLGEIVNINSILIGFIAKTVKSWVWSFFVFPNNLGVDPLQTFIRGIDGCLLVEPPALALVFIYQARVNAISAETLSKFFQDKVRAVRDDTSAANEPTFTKLTDASFPAFQPCSTEEVRKFLIRSPPKSCSLDPVPTFNLREFYMSCSRSSASCATFLHQHGLLPESQKAAIVTPILKKHDLDPDDVKSYRPISNLTFISKSSNGLLLRSWRATFRWTGSFLTTNQPTDRGTPRRLLFLRSSQIFWTQLTRLRWCCSDC